MARPASPLRQAIASHRAKKESEATKHRHLSVVKQNMQKDILLIIPGIKDTINALKDDKDNKDSIFKCEFLGNTEYGVIVSSIKSHSEGDTKNARFGVDCYFDRDKMASNALYIALSNLLIQGNAGNDIMYLVTYDSLDKGNVEQDIPTYNNPLQIRTFTHSKVESTYFNPLSVPSSMLIALPDAEHFCVVSFTYDKEKIDKYDRDEQGQARGTFNVNVSNE